MWYIQALPGKTSHFGSRDKVKVLFSLRVKKCHCLHSCVIGGHPENLTRRYVRLKCCKHYVKHVEGFVNHLKGMISSWGNPGAIPSTFPPWVGSYKSPPTLNFEHLISLDWIQRSYQLVRMRHPRRVSAHDVEVGSGGHPSSSVPLHLRSNRCGTLVLAMNILPPWGRRTSWGLGR